MSLLTIIVSLIAGFITGMIIYWKYICVDCSSSQEKTGEYAQEDVSMPPHGLLTDHRSCGVGDIIKGSIPWRESYMCEPNSVERNSYYGGRPNVSCPNDTMVVTPYVVSGTTDMTTYHKLL